MNMKYNYYKNNITKAYKSFIGCNTFQIHFYSMIKGYDTGQLFFAMNENADIPFWSMV